MKKLVFFTGAGMSADSGLSTFRDSDGLWDKYRIEDVCTPEALAKNRKLVIDFYNIRRKELLSKQPNAGHLAIQRLENYFDVEVITQNIDDLHERAGSKHITHLHGELRKLRSSKNETLTVPIEGWEQHYDDRCEDGSLLRPFVVFFGESVPMFDCATQPLTSSLSWVHHWLFIPQPHWYVIFGPKYRSIWLTPMSPTRGVFAIPWRPFACEQLKACLYWQTS